MDKYTYSLKSDKLLKVVRQGDYATAVKIADTLEWEQEKNFRLLSAGAEAYEKMNRIPEAIDLLLRAYEYSAVGKRVLYKLTELAIRSNNISDAETFYKKYLEEAPDDNNRYVLRYMIAEAKHEDIERRIIILETYRKYEFEEEWAYKLAELYYKTNRRKECVALCDEIILWYGVGPYVDKAMDLKEQYEPLTDAQRDHRDNRPYYENRVRQVAHEMKEATAKKVVGGPKNAEPDDDDDYVPETEAAGAVAPLTEQERMETEERFANHTAGVDISMIQEEVEKEEQIVHLQNAITSNFQSYSMEESEEEETPAPESDEADAPETEVFMAPEESMSDTRDLKDIAEWTSSHSQPVFDSDEPTKEVIIPREMLENRVTIEEEEPEIQASVEEEAELSLIEEPVEEDTLTPETAEAVADEPETDSLVFEESAEEEAAAEPAETVESAEAAESVDTVESVETAEAVDTVESVETAEAAASAACEADGEAPDIPVFEHDHCLFMNVVSGEDAIENAVDTLEAYYEKKEQDMSPISKIQAEKLNRLGLIHSLPQLKNKDLIIEQAGKLSDIILREMLEILAYLDTEKVFVLMDSAMAIRELKQRMLSLSEADSEQDEEEEIIPKIHLSSVEELVDPVPAPAPAEDTAEDDMPAAASDEEASDEEDDEPENQEDTKVSFKNIKEDQVLSEKDFIRYAEYFAHELECVLDDSAYDSLEDIMDEMRRNGDKLTAGDVEAVIEDAAESAEKMGMRRLFAAKYNKEGFLILRRKNF